MCKKCTQLALKHGVKLVQKHNNKKRINKKHLEKTFGYKNLVGNKTQI